MDMRKLLDLMEATTTPTQGVTGQKLAQTSGGQFMNRADRTNQTKVNAALGGAINPATGKPYVAGRADTNLALAKKFSQPATVAAAPPAATNIPAPSADNEALKGQTIAKAMNPTPVASNPATASADTRGAAAMASKSAPAAPEPVIDAPIVSSSTLSPMDREEEIQRQQRLPYAPPAPNNTNSNTAQTAPTQTSDQIATAALNAPTPDTRGAAAMASKSAPTQTSDQIATAALNAPATDVSGTSKNIPAAYGQMAEEEIDENNMNPTPGQTPPANKTNQSKLPSMYDVDKANRKEIASQFDPNSTYVNPHDKDTKASAPGSKAVNTMADFEEDVDHALAEMMRLSGLTLSEKAPPGKKAERMVKHIKKGYAKDGKLTDKEKSIAFATAWKQHNKEKVNEGMDIMLDEDGHTLKHIVNRFKHETKNFMNTGFMAENLYDALYDYYLDRGDMPYGIAKAREGDPYEWVEEHFYADMGSEMSEGTVAEQTVDPLSELARLAGLSEDGPGAARLYGDGKKPSSTFNPIDTLKQVANKGIDLYNKREQARKDYWDSIKWADGSGGKPGGSGAVADLVPRFQTDADTRLADKDKTSAPIATPATTKADAFKDAMGSGSGKAQADDKLKECGDMEMDSHTMQKDKVNITTNMSSDGTKDVVVNAQGDAAEDLLAMLKLAGMQRHDKPAMVMIDTDEEMMEADRVSEYENTPEEEYQTVDSILRQGADLNREKRQYKKEYPGDNPMAESMLDSDLNDILESILIREEQIPTTKDPETGRVKAILPKGFFRPGKKRDPASQETPMEPESPESRTTGPRHMKVDGERTGTEKEKGVDEGWEDVSNFFGDLMGTEASQLRHSDQLRQLDAMRKQYKGTPYEKQVNDRYDQHLERRQQDKGEVVGKDGEPIKVLPPDQWKGGKQ